MNSVTVFRDSDGSLMQRLPRSAERGGWGVSGLLLRRNTPAAAREDQKGSRRIVIRRRENKTQNRVRAGYSVGRAGVRNNVKCYYVWNLG